MGTQFEFKFLITRNHPQVISKIFHFEIARKQINRNSIEQVCSLKIGTKIYDTSLRTLYDY